MDELSTALLSMLHKTDVISAAQQKDCFPQLMLFSDQLHIPLF